MKISVRFSIPSKKTIFTTRKLNPIQASKADPESIRFEKPIGTALHRRELLTQATTALFSFSFCFEWSLPVQADETKPKLDEAFVAAFNKVTFFKSSIAKCPSLSGTAFIRRSSQRRSSLDGGDSNGTHKFFRLEQSRDVSFAASVVFVKDLKH